MQRFWLLNLGLILIAPGLLGCKRRALPDPTQENTLPAPPNARPQPQVETDAPKPANAIELSAQSDKTKYGRGETIKFTIVAQNKSDSTQTLTFTSGRTFDLSATAKDAKAETWRWARDKFFTQAFKNIALKPGDSRTFTATWDQKADNGQLAPRGIYNVTAELPVAEPIISAPIEVELVD